MKKLTVAVLFGGCSEEYGISLKSAYTIITHLDRQKYEPLMIGISREGEWLKYEGPVSSILQDSWQEEPCCRPAILSPDRHNLGLWELTEKEIRHIPVDVVFPVLHGKYGEDGTLQGLLELSGIPYVGCGVQSSVLCMDKELAKRVVQRAGVMIPRFNTLKSSANQTLALADRDLAYPLFVKPANSGSSFGVSKVMQADSLAAAIHEAFIYDRKVLIEEAVEGFEVGCAVLGNGDDLQVGEVDQIELSQGFFRIHQEAEPELRSENAVIHVPARISTELRHSIQQCARIVYSALGCSGLARVDLFLTPGRQIVFNEVNTMPGFTSYSRYPRMMEAAGFSISQIVDSLIQLAQKKAKEHA